MNNPKILVLGFKQHGKDTVAEILRDEHGIDFRSSSLFLAEAVVRPALAKRGILYNSLEECFRDRGNHRVAWRDAIAAHNGDDPTRLAQAILAECDCYVGMRSDREYQASRHLFDAVAWVEGTGRKLEDGTVLEPYDESLDIEFDPVEMHLIDNTGDLDHLRAEVRALMDQIDSTERWRTNRHFLD